MDYDSVVTVRRPCRLLQCRCSKGDEVEAVAKMRAHGLSNKAAVLRVKLFEAWIGRHLYVRMFQSLGLVGAVGGAVMGALSAQSLGRCRTMAVSVIGILCTWLCVGCAQEVWYLYTGRFINGFFAGMLSLVVPAQISELADPRNRGLQGARHFIGMLFGSIYVTLLGRYVTWSMLAFTCLLPVAVLVPLSWFLVESPRWLLQIGQRERAMEMQRNLRKEPVEANAEFKLMEKAFSGTPMPSLHYWLSTHIMFTQQFCGANMAATCASVLMGPTGVYADREDTDLAILITQVMFVSCMRLPLYCTYSEVAVALAALPLVDTVGRLRLLVVSANVCVASMISLGSMYPNMLIDAASETTTSTLSTAANASELDVGVTIVPGSRLGLVFLIVFFFGYALGIGSVTWIQGRGLHVRRSSPLIYFVLFDIPANFYIASNS
ncbi:hypothetical protein HPB51_015489 [Rhipicephalus microplus]|uniref:Major facilitator superfamily (MFS) profile domain-containing protein n=1 Tax=Rhipicephalus microplus TaxID=6941 RepID=A0A9J6F4M7_RHIMP|nr:hypothetical protein HPB51_015489 [Rhipicephalus microplus]